MRFNSIVSIEFSKKTLGGPEMNSLVNPGAIATTSMVKGASRDEVWNSILGYYSDFAGRPLTVDQEVFKSEADTNQRNQAIGYLMYAYGYIKANPMQATDVYTEQCSVAVNAKDLATMAATLANAGKNPVTGKQVMKAANVPHVLAVMATAGLYDDSGKWLYRTGLPGKSGVGGGLIAGLARQVRHRGRVAAARRRGQQREGAEGHRGHLERARRQSVRAEALARRGEGRTGSVGRCPPPPHPSARRGHGSSGWARSSWRPWSPPARLPGPRWRPRPTSSSCVTATPSRARSPSSTGDG
jgi:hypothetical protein